jgi:hypothetical protein
MWGEPAGTTQGCPTGTPQLRHGTSRTLTQRLTP